MEQIKNFNKRINSEFFDLNDNDSNCFLCGKPDYKPWYEISDYGSVFEFKKCQCGIIKQIPMPNEKFFKMFFNSNLFFSSNKERERKIWGYDDYFRDENLRFKTSKYRVNRLKKYVNSKQKLKILKIGPATGSLLGILKNKGHKVFGIDISKKFVDFASENYGVKIENGRFEKHNYKDEQFDVIFLFNVIENVNNLDEFFNEIRRVLKTNGLFVFNFVDMKNNIVEKLQKEKYFIYRPPVCYIFDMPVIKKVLKKYSLEPVKIIKDIRYLSVEKIISLLGWQKVLKIANFLKLNRIYFPLYAYPSKIIVAKKNGKCKH